MTARAAARQVYPDRDTLMRGLAELVADQLRAALASKGRATLAVPGGTTPGPFLSALSEAELDWRDVTVMLTDERVVPEFSERSNTRLLRETLIQNEAAAAKLLHFHAAVSGIELVLDTIRARVAEALPLDVTVLGMGADMHTASLFPNAPELAEALSETAPDVVAVHPPDQPEARVTLSAPVLRGSDVIHILLTGPEKLAALDRALGAGPVAEAPIRAVLDAPCPVTVHYAD
ncbi:MAG: 6-phosphogluconolactonase [Rhodovulum sulfidophilum]|uniref:6-phosphogluconolactonase n=1 Tax=Rhodovulum sulfidophilum TaxID=35806 RepID=A0A2W5NJA4_RHOSU|nr:MAG: 6-phosphogluconolactonase [Rhodovulum sulfidophilum]